MQDWKDAVSLAKDLETLQKADPEKFHQVEALVRKLMDEAVAAGTEQAGQQV